MSVGGRKTSSSAEEQKMMVDSISSLRMNQWLAALLRIKGLLLASTSPMFWFMNADVSPNARMVMAPATDSAMRKEGMMVRVMNGRDGEDGRVRGVEVREEEETG